ncbi:MAG: hypothetical protein UU51_C0027G0002 [Microgenomates group bacterium GW2011_GWC1_41_20]|uniref:Uncharacterized protein n=2 Tax=Candidatus Woeseibacteriota TaxID=1752722 RepID=A0A1F8DG71_9BACT|nr:MAG: hypothetical protein UU51_C0027G0002 [Microgenomates group bacterium GW2011_GWC1_41_20]OGM87610.1 MAG: hypothetical protein A2594_01835 [Candidatus Woesebacteria bacterium RIFOXYD1_FULL_41_28]
MEESPVQSPTSSINVPPVNNTSQDVPSVKLSSAKLVAFMFILIILLLGTTVFFFYQNSQLKKQVALLPTPSPIALETPNPTADWKIYTDAANSITLKYPSSWIYDAKSNKPNIWFYPDTAENRSEAIPTYLFTISPRESDAKTGKDFALEIKNDLISQNVENPVTVISEGVKIVGTYEGYQITTSQPEPVPTQQPKVLISQSIYLVKGGYQMVLSYSEWINKGSTTYFPQHGTEVDQILSTFTFIDATNSASPTQKACTLEAKICPDGSSVGRTGPNCEFAPCP